MKLPRQLEANKRYRARKRGENVPLRATRWTKDEERKLLDAYAANAGSKAGWLIAVSGELGRHKSNVVRKAKSLGCITDRNRNGHGDSITEDQRQTSSRRMLALLKSNDVRISTRGKSGKRADLNDRYFRSSWEANYARFLNYSKIEWEYENKTFWFEGIKRGTRSYTPDFYLPKTNEYHEVKGYMDPKSVTRMKRMAKYYPEVKIVVVDRQWFNAANKQRMCRLIPGWECQHTTH